MRAGFFEACSRFRVCAARDNQGGSGLPRKPAYHRPGDQIGGILLNEMAGARDRDKRQVVLDPVPRVVECAGQQGRVLQAMDQEDRTFDGGK